MAIEKLNDEELDMVTGGSTNEIADLDFFIGSLECHFSLSKMEEWLKTNLNINSSLSKDKANTYSITENGVTRTLKHEEVMVMLSDYLMKKD